VSLVLHRQLSNQNSTSHNTKSHTKSSKPAKNHNKIAHLQQTLGNQEIQRLVKDDTIQAKLKISQPNDQYEQEADRVANQIMRMSNEEISVSDNNDADTIHRKCSSCQMKQEEELEISRQFVSSNNNLEAPDEITPQINNTSGGRPLDSSTKSFMESRFNHDFSDVRIHDDSKSNELAGAVNARAFTTSSDIFLGKNESTSNKHLMAHELTHVIQQNKKTLEHVENNTIPNTKNGIKNNKNKIKRKIRSLVLQRYAYESVKVNWGNYGGGTWFYFLRSHLDLGKRRIRWPQYDKTNWVLNFNNVERNISGYLVAKGYITSDTKAYKKVSSGIANIKLDMLSTINATKYFHIRWPFKINNEGKTKIHKGRITVNDEIPREFPWNLSLEIIDDSTSPMLRLGLKEQLSMPGTTRTYTRNVGYKNVGVSGSTTTGTPGHGKGQDSKLPLAFNIKAKKIKPLPPPPQKVSDYNRFGPVLYKTGSTSVVKRKNSYTPNEVIQGIRSYIPAPPPHEKEKKQGYNIVVEGYASDCVKDKTRQLEINQRIAHARAISLHTQLRTIYGKINVSPLTNWANIKAEKGKCNIFDQKVLVEVKTRPKSEKEHRP